MSDGAGPQAATPRSGGQALDQLTRLVSDLGQGIKSRVEAVEAAQTFHREEVEARLNRYEDVQNKVADRVVSSVERLAKLETIPDRLGRMEADLLDVRRAQVQQASLTEQAIKATNNRVSKLESQLQREEAEQTGQKQAARVALESVKFLLDYGWKIVVVAGGGLLALAQYDQFMGQPSHSVTIQQPAPAQASAQDWPLRTE